MARGTACEGRGVGPPYLSPCGVVKPTKTTASGETTLQDSDHIKALFRLHERNPKRGSGAAQMKYHHMVRAAHAAAHTAAHAAAHAAACLSPLLTDARRHTRRDAAHSPQTKQRACLVSPCGGVARVLCPPRSQPVAP